MAVRTPLYNNAGNIQQMTSTMIDEIIAQVVYQYSVNPGVALSVVGSGGNLGTISDTRLQAGAASTSTTGFPSEATTAEPSVVTVNYSKINQSLAGTSLTADTGKLYPVYLDGSNNMVAMTLQDMKDTFIHPAIDLLTSGSTTTSQAGTYYISSTASVSGATEVSGISTAVFSNTEADTSQYTAAGIGETLDQPQTLQNFYLQRITRTNPTYTLPMYIRNDDNIQVYPTSDFETMIKNLIDYTAESSADGYSISYNLGTSGSGNTRGSGMTDTRLNGSGNYQTLFVNADDYRAQEFPNGTSVAVNTYYLRINKS